MQKESKFLLKRMPIISTSMPNMIAKAYYENNGFIDRYRGEQGSESLSYTKSRRGDITIEEHIEQEVFINCYKNSNKKLTKNRFIYRDEFGNTWKIDKYMFLELMIAICLSDGEKDLVIPKEIKKVVLVDIANNEAFSDYNLSDDFETLN